MRRQPIASRGVDAPAASPMTPEEPADDGGHRVGAPTITPAAPGGLRRIAANVATPANWRVRTKLIAILAVPMIAILVNASQGANTVLSSTQQINRVRNMIQISRAATTLTFELERERTYTIGYVASAGQQRSLDAVKAAQARVDQAARDYEDTAKGRQNGFSEQTRAAIQAAADRLSRRQNVRATALTVVDPGTVTVAYTTIINSLVNLVALIPQGQDDGSLLADVVSADSIARSGELLAAQQALVYGILQKQQFDNSDYRAFVGFHTERESQISRFEGAATGPQRDSYGTTVTGQDVSQANDNSQTVLTGRVGQPLDLDAQKWLRSTQQTMDLNHKVLTSLFSDTDSRVQTLRSTIQRKALVAGLLIVFILAAALLMTMVVARSLVRPLLGLRAAALDIAGSRLPEAVRRLRDSTDQDIDTNIQPVGIDTEEEIGEVARAFDEVHREAVRLASEQAVLRNNVNAMFVNLSRRSQGLVERQLRLIDDLENREQDPDQLSNLFKLDHLATRMRRNNESLLVLAGTDTARRWTHPVPLNEVVLAAISEVEQYTRVKQSAAAPVSIAGHAVSDVVHLIAELLENATSFSPPATEVLVTSHSLGPGAGAMIEIEDRGIGMPAKDLERVNERLANPPVVDVSVSRTMGLFAVGRLATRHGIRVQLRESTSGGITAVVRLPAKVVAGDPSSSAPARPASTVGGGRPSVGSRPAADNAFPAAMPNGNFTANGRTLAKDSAFSNGSAQLNGHAPLNGSDPRSVEPQLGFPPLPSPAPHMASHDDQDRGRRPGADGMPADSGFRQAGSGGLDVGSTRFGGTKPGPDALSSATGPQNIIAGDRSGTDFPAATGPSSDGYEIPRGPTVSPWPAASDTGPISTGPINTGPIGNRQPAMGPTGFGMSEPTDHVAPDTVWGAPKANADPAFGRAAVTHEAYEAYEGGRSPGTMPTASNQPDDFSPDQADAPLDDSSFVQASAKDDQGAEHELDDADTTPIFDSVSAWFQRRSPAPALPTRRAVPPPSPLRRPGPAINRGPAVQRADSRPAEPLSRLGGRANTIAGGESTRPGSSFPPPGRLANPAPATSQDAASPELPVRAGAGMGLPPAYSPEAMSSAMVTGVGDATAASAAPGAISWSSAGDAGWQAAEAARQPASSGTTRAGLPLRVPMTHLVPGSAEPGPRRRPPDTPPRSPEAVGGRLASFYQGVRQGRDVTRDAAPRRDAQEDM
ncbi:nitrate- and nitrite sensing domain-containing protein [Frankia sp. CIT1]|uniref:sensor histidine kinase n=1 Tax=Frankia sp. CIT1 TaxID=2880974 RepID=UPI001EF5C5EF|nr:nitrate- and nitrite sensing domain-containing protein [Frankia sp. CIT1]